MGKKSTRSTKPGKSKAAPTDPVTNPTASVDPLAGIIAKALNENQELRSELLKHITSTSASDKKETSTYGNGVLEKR